MPKSVYLVPNMQYIWDQICRSLLSHNKPNIVNFLRDTHFCHIFSCDKIVYPFEEFTLFVVFPRETDFLLKIFLMPNAKQSPKFAGRVRWAKQVPKRVISHCFSRFYVMCQGRASKSAEFKACHSFLHHYCKLQCNVILGCNDVTNDVITCMCGRSCDLLV